jgi:DNA-binding NarL/FixJ family response regulator
MRVLIVDDHDAVRAAVLRLLEGEPELRAAGVAGGQEAVLASRHDAFDVVVVDYQLGRDLCRAIRDASAGRHREILDVLAAPPGLALVGT